MHLYLAFEERKIIDEKKIQKEKDYQPKKKVPRIKFCFINGVAQIYKQTGDSFGIY